MSIFLSQDNSVKIVQLPVMPESISFSNGSQNKVVDLINLGQASFLSGDPLKSINFNSWLPASEEVTGLTNFQEVEEPQFYIDIINEFRTNKKPVRLVIEEIKLSQLVSIESFDNEIVGGSDEYSYSLSFREFRQIEVKEIINIEIRLNPVEEPIAESAQIIASTRPNDKLVPVEVVVVSGDTLWKIAKRELGDGSRYPEIASANNIKTPYTIFPGQVVLMPI